MAYYPDLSPCDYFGKEFAPVLRAVGWLDRDHNFPTGTVDRQVFERLKTLSIEPWQPIVFAGVHRCELCLYDDGPFGGSNVFIPGTTALYVCPELILHYMSAHHYSPPAEFLEAVSGCPEMRSMTYLKALVATGGSIARAARRT